MCINEIKLTSCQHGLLQNSFIRKGKRLSFKKGSSEQKIFLGHDSLNYTFKCSTFTIEN